MCVHIASFCNQIGQSSVSLTFIQYITTRLLEDSLLIQQICSLKIAAPTSCHIVVRLGILFFFRFSFFFRYSEEVLNKIPRSIVSFRFPSICWVHFVFFVSFLKIFCLYKYPDHNSLFQVCCGQHIFWKRQKCDEYEYSATLNLDTKKKKDTNADVLTSLTFIFVFHWQNCSITNSDLILNVTQKLFWILINYRMNWKQCASVKIVGVVIVADEPVMGMMTMKTPNT